MKFTIGTVSNSLDFAEDMNLIKSSILYADDIELIGMAEYAIYKYLPRQLNASKDLESLFKNFIPLLQSVGTEESRQALQQIDFATQQIKILADKIALFVSAIVSSGAQHYIEENGICEYPATQRLSFPQKQTLFQTAERR